MLADGACRREVAKSMLHVAAAATISATAAVTQGPRATTASSLREPRVQEDPPQGRLLKILGAMSCCRWRRRRSCRSRLAASVPHSCRSSSWRHKCAAHWLAASIAHSAVVRLASAARRLAILTFVAIKISPHHLHFSS